MSKPLTARALGWQDAGGMGVLAGVSALVSGMVALALAAVLMLVGVYEGWRLTQVQTLFVYVSADADAGAVAVMADDLRALQPVRRVTLMPEDDVRQELAAYGNLVANLPLPKVVAVELRNAEDVDAKNAVIGLVQQKFEHAEVDDASLALASVAQAVRLSLKAGVAMIMAMMLVLGGVMIVTVRAGLRAKQPALKLLMQLGARDATLVALAIRGVAGRLVAGWLLGSGLAALGTVSAAAAWPPLGAVITWQVWGAVVCAPLLLLLLGVAAAAWVAAGEVRRLG